MEINNRLARQLNFLYEIDKLKTVFRKTALIGDSSRRENAAEHSWHLAFYVLVLSEYVEYDIDILRVLKMVLIHDIAEIDAGDVFFYDKEAVKANKVNEEKAAKRIFALLPEEQYQEYLQLWLEFEKGETNEAKFAIFVDKFQPFLHNYKNNGGTWLEFNISRQQISDSWSSLPFVSAELSEKIDEILDEAAKNDMVRI